MNAGRIRSRLSTLLPFGALAILSGCAISQPATLASAQASGTELQSVYLLSDDEDNALRSRLDAALRSAMGDRSTAVEEGADLIGDFGISARDATLAVQSIADTNEGADSLEMRFRNRFYHSCRPDRIRATLVLYARESGEMRGRAEGEFLACPGDFGELNNLAQLLVDEAMGD